MKRQFQPWPGGSFDKDQWERQRAALHHNDYHYRFYHYLGKSSGESEERLVEDFVVALTRVSRSLPEAVEKAFRHWRAISRSLRDLFSRAPREAIADPESVYARMAIEEVGKRSYPALAAKSVRERAGRNLAERAERSNGLIECAVAEARHLVGEMDEFVSLFDKEGCGMGADEAELRARRFLDNCRRLDRELSEMTRRLRGRGA